MTPSQSPAQQQGLSAFSLPMVPGIPLYRGCVEEDLKIVSRNRLADEITGGLSRPGKLPCPSIGISAHRCRTGSVLAEIAGTTCENCYALKGNYHLPSVQERLETRYQGLHHPLWVPALVFLVNYHCSTHFRHFDSGDLQDENHLRNIFTVARHTPEVLHWLPTRENAIVRACASEVPDNLTIRVSATMVDGAPPTWWPTTSTVVSDGEGREDLCIAPEQENKCEACRCCWDRGVKNIAYVMH